uniref:Uncharacterized protein LOC111116587 n=1 Tax=Crassostrea virginica TaxID=6565 RepID=A0A8B8C6R3_CRAVI|nr:uncharacterized protein LOC111116587 [Crassostrea virginica]
MYDDIKTESEKLRKLWHQEVDSIFDKLDSMRDAEAWISGNNRTITRVDIHGIAKDSLTTTCQFGPCGIALTRKGELIFIDRDNATINIVRHGKSMTLITTPWGWVPWGLYCTRSGDILVHISFFFDKHKIIRYQEQRKTQEIVNDRQGKPIFEDGLGKLYMSENNNGDICVSDTSANTVVVVDKAGRVRFRYDGKQAFREKTFVPKGIVTDKFSQIIVADYNNCLHILDQNGQFLRCVDKCGLEKPHELSVDSKGRLWVGCESGKIKLIQYLTNA